MDTTINTTLRLSSTIFFFQYTYLDHRITEWSGLERTSVGYLVQSPPPKQGHLQQAAQDLVQLGLEYLRRKRLHNLPGQPVPVLRLPQREEVKFLRSEKSPRPKFLFWKPRKLKLRGKDNPGGMEKASWMHCRDFQWGSLLCWVLSGSSSTKRARWLQGRSRLSRTGNDYVYGRERVIPGVRFIPYMLYLSWLQRRHHCQKDLS